MAKFIVAQFIRLMTFDDVDSDPFPGSVVVLIIVVIVIMHILILFILLVGELLEHFVLFFVFGFYLLIDLVLRLLIHLIQVTVEEHIMVRIFIMLEQVDFHDLVLFVVSLGHLNIFIPLDHALAHQVLLIITITNSAIAAAGATIPHW